MNICRLNWGHLIANLRLPNTFHICNVLREEDLREKPWINQLIQQMCTRSPFCAGHIKLNGARSLCSRGSLLLEGDGPMERSAKPSGINVTVEVWVDILFTSREDFLEQSVDFITGPSEPKRGCQLLITGPDQTLVWWVSPQVRWPGAVSALQGNRQSAPPTHYPSGTPDHQRAAGGSCDFALYIITLKREGWWDDFFTTLHSGASQTIWVKSKSPPPPLVKYNTVGYWKNVHGLRCHSVAFL